MARRKTSPSHSVLRGCAAARWAGRTPAGQGRTLEGCEPSRGGSPRRRRRRCKTWRHDRTASAESLAHPGNAYVCLRHDAHLPRNRGDGRDGANSEPARGRPRQTPVAEGQLRLRRLSRSRRGRRKRGADRLAASRRGSAGSLCRGHAATQSRGCRPRRKRTGKRTTPSGLFTNRQGAHPRPPRIMKKS